MALTNQANLDSEFALPDSTQEQATTLSNELVTANMTTDFLKIKSSSKSYGKAGDELTQTITLTNNSQYAISGVQFLDNLSSGATFKTGTVTINGVSEPTLNPITGFTLSEDIEASGGTATITYVIVVDDPVSVNTITNTATLSYTADGTSITESTNTITIDIINNKLTMVKSGSVNVVKSGDTLTYTIVLTNEGNVKNTNLNFKDEVPAGTTFVSGSVEIDGVSQPTYNPNTGFALADLDVGESITVKFDVQIN